MLPEQKEGLHRLVRLTESLEEDGLLGVWFTDLINIRYLTGFTGSNAVFFFSRLEGLDSVLFTDGRYEEQANNQLRAHGVEALCDVRIGAKDAERFLKALRPNRSRKSLGFEAAALTWQDFQSLQSALAGKVDLSPLTGLVEKLRSSKTPHEISLIAKACSIGDEALKRCAPLLLTQITERDFAAELDYTMVKLGAAGPSFETIVASGTNGAMPHARPSSKQIVTGDLVVVDFGATYGGYHSDCTRTFAVGSPSKEQKSAQIAVTEAQAVGVAAASAGVAISEVDRICRDVLKNSGLERYFTHGLGHGVGLRIHEAPWINGGNPDLLQEGEIITIEPGVYLPGHFGVRIEDTICVKEGTPKVLTDFPKDWLLE